MNIRQSLSSASQKLLLLPMLVASVSNATTFNFSDFSSVPSLNLVGVAAPAGTALRLTPSSPSTAGAAWFNNLVDVSTGFTTFFTFKITNQFAYRADLTIASEAEGADGGDGLTFVVQNASPTPLGLANGGIGFMGISNSLAVVFDSWKNIPYCDNNNNHIAVQSMGVNPNGPVSCAGPNNANLGSYNPLINFSDGNPHQAEINYTPGSLKVYFTDLSNPVLDIPVNLGSLLNLSGGTKAYIGLTSSTGGAWENHDIVNWSFSNVPEPTTLSLVGISAALLAAARLRKRS